MDRNNVIRSTRSLNARIILVVVLSLATVLSLSFWVLGRYQKQQLMKHMQDHSSQLNSAISYALNRDMLRSEAEDIVNSIRNLEQRQEGITRIFVLNAEGKIAFSSKPEEKGEMLKEESISLSCRQACHGGMPDAFSRTTFFEDVEKQRILRSIDYIQNPSECQECHPKEEKILGALLIDTSLRRVEDKISANSKIISLSGLLALLFAAFVTIILLQRLVVKPIEQFNKIRKILRKYF